MTITENDTICAVSTPHGVGGIAVIRVSGPKAIAITDSVWHGRRLSNAASHTAHLGTILDEAGETIDSAVATVYRNPASFTGEDVVELSVHGSTWIQRETLQLLIRKGCRLAQPGEFTRRAFSAGKLDLAEAEAVADIIASSSRAAHKMAMSQMRGDFSQKLRELHDRLLELASLLELELDFSEEDVEFASREKLSAIADEIYGVVSRLTSSFATGSALKDGIPVAIVGATNAGKSTLLNRLLGDDRAIVSDIHGTTRDIIEDRLEINGVMFRLIDTAGLRETSDSIEAIGIERTIAQLNKASIVIWVVDPFSPAPIIEETFQRMLPHLSTDKHLIIALNKSDLPGFPSFKPSAAPNQHLPHSTVTISAETGAGIESLTDAMVNASGLNEWQNEILVTNTRHYEALSLALESINRVRTGLTQGLSGDFIAQDVRETLHHLGQISGTITTDTILTTIFSRFCIGK